MIDGRIVKTGGHDLAHRIEREGYDKIREEIRRRCLAPLAICRTRRTLYERLASFDDTPLALESATRALDASSRCAAAAKSRDASGRSISKRSCPRPARST